MNIKNIIDKGKKAVESGVKNSKELYELSKKRANSEVHKQRKKVALSVIDEAKNKVNKTDKEHLKEAGKIIKSKFEKGGEVENIVLKTQPNFKYKKRANDWLNDIDKDSLKYKLAILLLQEVEDPNEILEIKNDSQYSRLLRSLEKIKGESEHEMAWRTENYTLNDAEKWTKDSLKEVFYIEDDNDKFAKGGKVGKGELVWGKLTNSEKTDFLYKNFTPLITPRTQETLVGKAYNFLPKSVKIKIESEYANKEEYEGGGKVDSIKLKKGEYVLVSAGYHKNEKAKIIGLGKIETGVDTGIKVQFEDGKKAIVFLTDIFPINKLQDGGSIKKLEDIDKGDTIYYLNNELTVNSLMQWSDGSIESITALRKSDNKIFVLNKKELKHVSLKPNISEDSKSNVTYYDVRYNKIVNEESIPEIKTFTDKKSAEDFAKKHYTQVDVRTKKYEDGGSVEDVKFNYMMLDRLRSDCDYYLGNGNRSERRLRGENVNEHIKEMKRLWNNLKVKPEWLSMEDIEEYERKMKNNKMEKGGKIYSETMKEFNAYGKTFLVAENGVVKKVKDYYDNGTIKEVEVKGNIYKYNSTYKTYNDAKNNILSAKDLGNDIDLFEQGGKVSGVEMGGETELDNEIFLSLLKIYKEKGNSGTDLFSFSENKLRKLLSEDAFDRIKSGGSPLGKIKLYGGRLGQYYALNIANGDFYKRLKNQYAKGGGVGFRNIDKIKSNIGEVIFDHITSLTKPQLEKQLSQLKSELKIADKESNRYTKLKDEEWYILYRLERSNDFEYEYGGSIEDENREMVLNENNQIIHHTKELPNAIKGKRVPAWVVTKVHESASDLSDATHYMDGQKMANGGSLVGTKVKVSFRKEIGVVKDYDDNWATVYYPDLGFSEKVNLKTENVKIVGEMAKGGAVSEDNKFNYMMLGRLQTDCDYYLGNGNRSERVLWAGNVDDHIEEMKKIWNSLPKDGKPEWLSMEDIEEYERKMKNEYEDGGYINSNDIDAELENFDIDDLDSFETMLYEQYLPSLGKVGALQVIINNVEGDYTQLSEGLAILAEKQISNQEWDEESMRRNGYEKGGFVDKIDYENSIGFIPMDLEQDLVYISKWGNISIKETINILNAIVDSGLTTEEIKPILPKSTMRWMQIRDGKTKEVWNKIEKYYKGNLIGNQYFQALHDLISKKPKLIDQFRPFRKMQKFQDGGIINNGEYGAIIDWKNFTLNELDAFLKYWSIGKGEIEINLFAPKGVDYVRTIDYKKYGNEKLSVGDVGKQAKITKGSENIYLDITVYNEKNEEYVIGLYSKENHNGLKQIAKDLIDKYAKGGGVKDDFDWNKVFEPLSPEEEKELFLKLKKEEKDTITNEKNIHAKNIRAKGSNWNEAFIFRVKSARYSISKFIEWAKKKDDEKAKDWFNESLEHIDSIKELGYEARRYGNSMEKRLRNYYDELYIKNNKNPKYAKGGTIQDAKSIFDKYEKNEDNNYNAENIVLLAKHFGTDEDIDTANKIIKQRNKLGYMPKDMSEKSSEISKRLYPKLIQELNQTNNKTNTMTQEQIEKFVGIAKSTNKVASEIAIKKLKEAGLDKNGKEIKAEEPKQVRKVVAKKVTPKKVESTPKKVEKSDEPDCDDLYDQYAKRKKAQQKAKNAPQKTETTKNKEKIEKVEDSIDAQFKSGKLTKAMLQKMYDETKALLKKIEKYLAKL
jgi:hypothetical protein